MKRILIFSALILLSSLISLGAQEPAGQIVFADGNAFSIIRAGLEKNYDLYEVSAEGLVIYEGDYLLTEKDTFLEIRLKSGSVVKVSENTNFRLSRISEAGFGTFELTYGRVRSKVEKLTGTEEFRVTGQSTVAGVRGTDFGFDVIAGLQSDKGALTRVYCFEGQVEVVKYTESPLSASAKPLATVIIEKNEMVEIMEAVKTDKLGPVQLPEELAAYWDTVAFSEKEKLEDKLLPEIKKNNEELKKLYKKSGFALIFASTVMEAAGFAFKYGGSVLAPGLSQYDSGRLGSAFIVSGGIFMVQGIMQFLMLRGLD